MLKIKISILIFCISLYGCSAPSAKDQVGCGNGRTILDGVCVAQDVADYVSCVRAQGVELGSEKSKSLRADAGAFGVSVSAANEVAEKLSKKYSASDKVMMVVIERCSTISGNYQSKVKSNLNERTDVPENGLMGAWKINANGHIGKFEIKEVYGTLTGRIWFDKYKRWEKISSINIDKNTIEFHRSRQRYSGEYEGGKLVGMFYSSGRNYNWTAVR